MLRTLLDRHRDIRPEADRTARGLLENIRAGDVATAVERAMLGVDPDRLAERSGRKRWGYDGLARADGRTLKEVTVGFINGEKAEVLQSELREEAPTTGRSSCGGRT